MIHNVERRAQEARHETTATDHTDDLGPWLKMPDDRPVQPRHAQETAPARPTTALTRRERRVKDILLKELAKMSDARMLTYSEKQHLEKTLNVAYIDRELAKMRKRRAWNAKMRTFALIPFGVLVTGLFIWSLFAGTVTDTFLNFITALALFYGSYYDDKAVQRKMFIYEALRELSDAEEVDVLLDRVAQDADALITRIVDAELEAAERYPSAFLNKVRG